MHKRLEFVTEFIDPELPTDISGLAVFPEKNGAVSNAQVFGKLCDIAIMVNGIINCCQNFRSDFHMFSLSFVAQTIFRKAKLSVCIPLRKKRFPAFIT